MRDLFLCRLIETETGNCSPVRGGFAWPSTNTHGKKCVATHANNTQRQPRIVTDANATPAKKKTVRFSGENDRPIMRRPPEILRFLTYYNLKIVPGEPVFFFVFLICKLNGIDNLDNRESGRTSVVFFRVFRCISVRRYPVCLRRVRV